jgi:hypothetical protein
VLTRWWRTALPEWQLAATPAPLVWQSGIDGPVVLTTLLAVALAVLTAWAYWMVRKMRHWSVYSAVTQSA